MSWTTLLTILSLVAGTAYLVLAEQWSYELAVRTMLGFGLVLLGASTAAIFWMTPADSRAEFWALIKAQIQKEIQAIRKTIWKN